MKTLHNILEQRSPDEAYFPVVGMTSGYGGEQDGSHAVILRVENIFTKSDAREVEIPDFVKLHWAQFWNDSDPRKKRWDVYVGYWSDVDMTEEDKKLLQNPRLRQILPA